MSKILGYLGRILINKNNCVCTVQRSFSQVTMVLPKQDVPIEQTKKTAAVCNIENVLKVHRRTALKLVNENRKLITTSPSTINENYEILKDNGLNSSSTVRYPVLLWTTKLREKILLLRKLDYPLSTTIVLAGLSVRTIMKIIESSSQSDRIFVLSQLLQFTPRETCEALYKKNFLITRDLMTIRDILKILQDFNISLEDIRKDPWILRYSKEIINDRIQFMRDENVELSNPKPWMLRSPLDVFESYYKRKQDIRQILGSGSLSEYLSEKLECTEEQARYLISKLPPLSTKSPKTLSDIINFLYSKGFKAYHIYRVPKILLHSVETTKKRLEQLEKVGIKVDTLYMLTKSQKQFLQNFEAMLNAKKASGSS